MSEEAILSEKLDYLEVNEKVLVSANGANTPSDPLFYLREDFSLIRSRKDL